MSKNNIFFISDTHFGHAKILTFKTNEGKPLRSFSCVEEMDEHIVSCWNKTVRPQDKVYHLGDIAINKKHLFILHRLNGHKRLVRGNHDIFPTKDLMEYFDEIYGVRVFSEHGLVCSHIPIHTESMSRWKLNLHGHLHSNLVMDKGRPDKRYKSACVEQINYTPISLEEVLDEINRRY